VKGHRSEAAHDADHDRQEEEPLGLGRGEPDLGAKQVQAAEPQRYAQTAPRGLPPAV
jgi:hypothetical protein